MQESPRESPLLDTPEGTAQRLNVGRTKVYELIATGELESITIGRLRRIPVDAIDAYIQRLRSGQAASGPDAA